MWIRIETNVGQNDKILQARNVLGLTTAQMVGHLVILWGQIAEHRPFGNVGDLHPLVLEEWAKWTGEPEAFGRAFLEVFVTDDMVTSWDEYQGKLIERQFADRDRKRAERASVERSTRTVRGQTEDVPRRSGATSTSTSTSTEEQTSSAAGAAGVKAAKPEKPRETWITPFADAWLEQYDGDMAITSALKPLRKLVKAHGDAEALRRWRLYLGASDAQYASAARFAATWGKWSAPPTTGKNGHAPDDPNAELKRRQGHVNARAARADGDLWLRRMRTEAARIGTNYIDYAYDHLSEPAEPAKAAS